MGKDYTWDAHYQLTSAAVPMGASGLEGMHAYTYDALGRRVSQTVDDTVAMSTTTTVFVCRTEPIPTARTPARNWPNTPAASAVSPLRKHAFASYCPGSAGTGIQAGRR